MSRQAGVRPGRSGWSRDDPIEIHDRHIVLPFNGLLQHYGLSPALLSNQTGQAEPMMVWHDLSVPTYDVVRVTPLSIYQTPKQTSTARVEILREYLEDYLLAMAALRSLHNGKEDIPQTTRHSTR